MSKTRTLTSHNIKKVIYSDFFTDFSVNSATGLLNKKTNELAVTQSVRNLLLTDHYERPFQPDIGSNLRAMLFENFTPATELQVEAYVNEVFDNHEPRAALLQVHTFPNVDLNSIGVTIVFSIINSTAPTQLDLMIERVR